METRSKTKSPRPDRPVVATSDVKGAEIKRHRLIQHDMTLSKRLAVCGHPVDLPKLLLVIRWACRLLEFSGHGLPWFLITIGQTSTSIRKDDILFWTNMIYALIVDLVVVVVVKAIFRRTRPLHATQHVHPAYSPDQFSFPSGHASRAVMMAVLFCYNWMTRPGSKLIIIVWAALVSLSRIVLGRHYFSDVLAGCGLGISLAWIFQKFLWLDLATCRWLLWPLHEYLFI